MNKDKQNSKFVSTKRNKGLEPMPLGDIGVVGYDPEIHGEDALEFTYKLPIGAIKRLIRSYFEEMKSIDAGGVYYGMSGSYEIRMYPYCNRMLYEIKTQLDKNGIEGRKVIDEVFDDYFKEDYEKMKRFSKNHGDNTMEAFKPCNDPLCCKKEKVQKGGL